MKKRELKKENGRKSVLLFLLFFFLLAVTSAVLGVLCLEEMDNRFIEKNFVPLAVAYSLFICGNTLFLVRPICQDKKKIAKGALSGYLLLVLLLSVGLLLLKWGVFERFNSPEELQEDIRRSGAWAPICFILLQFLQVTVLPIPSIVSTLAGVAIFGAFWAMIYSLIGILSGSILAFFIGRRFGFKAVAWLVGEESIRSWQKKVKGKDNLFLTAMFILPFFPDDILCFLAGLSSMSTRYFFVMIFVARLLGISATCYSFDFIPFNTWWGITFWAVSALIIACIFVVMSKKADGIQRFFSKLGKRSKKK